MTLPVTSLRVSKDAYISFKKVCAMNEISPSKMVEKMILQYTKREAKKHNIKLKEPA